MNLLPLATLSEATIRYHEIGNQIINDGVWVVDHRTGVKCKKIAGVSIEIDAGDGAQFPVITTRKSPIKMPLGELIGYWIGLDNAADFERYGAKTWYANANNNTSWLNNPNRKGEHDCGRIYGVIGRSFRGWDGTEIDQLQNIYDSLLDRNADRGLIMTFWNPAEFKYGCLRPCMHTYNYILLGEELSLELTSRSMDLPLGGVANIQQAYWALKMMAHMTGLKPKKVRINIADVHVYENQYDLFCEQMTRKILPAPGRVYLKNMPNSLSELKEFHPSDVVIEDYIYQPAINYPFTS